VAVAEPPPAPRPIRSPYPEVIRLLRAERWDAAVSKVDELAARDGMDAELAQHKAKALANLGLMEDAAREGEASLAMAPLDKHTYLITALIMVELGKLDKAQEALRKALFLDSNFVEAHFQNGLLQLRLGERKAGLRSLSNALELAERLDPQRQVHNAPGLVFGRLAEILRKELHMYQEE
jgi:chemotaxis protein methyltransferase CheR